MISLANNTNTPDCTQPPPLTSGNYIGQVYSSYDIGDVVKYRCDFSAPQDFIGTVECGADGWKRTPICPDSNIRGELSTRFLIICMYVNKNNCKGAHSLPKETTPRGRPSTCSKKAFFGRACGWSTRATTSSPWPQARSGRASVCRTERGTWRPRLGACKVRHVFCCSKKKVALSNKQNFPACLVPPHVPNADGRRGEYTLSDDRIVLTMQVNYVCHRGYSMKEGADRSLRCTYEEGWAMEARPQCFKCQLFNS